MYCKNCFRQFPDGARFCKHCGQPVAVQSLMIVSAGSAVLMLGILLVVLGQQKKPAQA